MCLNYSNSRLQFKNSININKIKVWSCAMYWASFLNFHSRFAVSRAKWNKSQAKLPFQAVRNFLEFEDSIEISYCSWQKFCGQFDSIQEFRDSVEAVESRSNFTQNFFQRLFLRFLMAGLELASLGRNFCRFERSFIQIFQKLFVGLCNGWSLDWDWFFLFRANLYSPGQSFNNLGRNLSINNSETFCHRNLDRDLLVSSKIVYFFFLTKSFVLILQLPPHQLAHIRS